MRRREPTHPGFASSRFGCGSRVSHPPAALRLPRPSGSFEPVTLMGFSPSKLSPPAEPWRLSTPDALLPLPVWKHVRDPKTTGCSGSGSASRRCSPRKSVADRTGVSRQAARCSPGVRRSRAFRSCVAPGFPRAPLSGLAGHRSCGNCRPLRVSIRSVVAAPFRQPYSPSALLAPRFRSACLEPAPFRACASGSGDITAPVTRPRNVRDFSQRARGENFGARYSGRYPTLADIIRDPCCVSQLVGNKRFTRAARRLRKYTSRHCLQATISTCAPANTAKRRAPQGLASSAQDLHGASTGDLSFSTTYPPIIHNRLAAYSASLERSPFRSST
ncbi:hypothetical protein BH18GEM1_BH18GEM1_10550 [soil metagenome]